MALLLCPEESEKVMAQDFARGFYDSTAWKTCRKAYMKKAGGLCERCLASGILRAADLVHHKIVLTPENITHPEISLSFDNLEAVCTDCHRALHENEHHQAHEKLRRKSRKRWRVDEFGHIVAK